MELSPAALRVFADELLERGDVLGEFILLQSERPAATPPSPRERELETLIGDRLKAALGERLQSFTFEHGLLEQVVIDAGDGPLTEVERLSRRPEALGLRTLVLHALCWDADPGLSAFFASLSSHPALPNLSAVLVQRGLDLGHPSIDGPATIGFVEPLYRAYPKLEALALHGVGLELGRIELPELTSFSASNLQPSAIPSLVEARWPKLRELTLVFDATPAEAEPVFGPLLDAPMSPVLERVVIQSPWPEFFRAALPRSPLGRGRHIEV